uniref:Calpain catalytic domain-containing protein n=1 Tax=Labrus bergylta TaxID=56723 RepID=A0A3Q3G3E3_9LABR
MPSPGVCMNIINARHKKDGYGTAVNPEKFLNQDFQQLKQCCLIWRVRFVNDMFPPDRNSIGEGLLSSTDMARVVWLRPGKLVPNPSFTVDGVFRFDLVETFSFLQGNYKGALTFQTYIFEQVVPLQQRYEEDYCGLFHFKFWRSGRWVDVVIDDKLPTIDGRLIFVHSTDPTEFWPYFISHTYLRIYLFAVVCGEAMVDFTGGVHVCVQLGVCNQGTPVNLVRVWNPWGQGQWKGDWSDKSPFRQTVSPEDREMCLSVADDGEFWMTQEDFCRFYSDLDICCLYGRWVAGTTAGGCMNHLESFWTNPQYRVTVEMLFSECSAKQGENSMLVHPMFYFFQCRTFKSQSAGLKLGFGRPYLSVWSQK